MSTEWDMALSAGDGYPASALSIFLTSAIRFLGVMQYGLEIIGFPFQA